MHELFVDAAVGFIVVVAALGWAYLIVCAGLGYAGYGHERRSSLPS